MSDSPISKLPKTSLMGNKRGESPNWLQLPEDLTMTILCRVGALDVLESVQRVCMAWRNIYKKPQMWYTINIKVGHRFEDYEEPRLMKLCENAVDRSSGDLVDITLINFGDDHLLKYITHRCGKIRCLRLVGCNSISDMCVSEVRSNLSHLEELEITECELSWISLKEFGTSCQNLKTLKFKCEPLGDINEGQIIGESSDDEDGPKSTDDDEANAIAAHMPSLHHLQLVGNTLTDAGLGKILAGCPHLQYLDMRSCFNVKLEGGLRQTCVQNIKTLRLPNEPLSDDEHIAAVLYYDSESCDDPS